jgi:DNA-directed RNA polymerase subunit E'/Rpb7
MIKVLPAGEYEIIKRTKYGIWVQIGTSKVFIPYSDTFYEERIVAKIDKV